MLWEERRMVSIVSWLGWVWLSWVVLKDPNLKISCKRALGWSLVVRTQDRMEIKDAVSKAQKWALGLSPSKWCLFLFWYFYKCLFLSLELLHVNSKDPKRASFLNPCLKLNQPRIHLEHLDLLWWTFSPLNRTFVSMYSSFWPTDS